MTSTIIFHRKTSIRLTSILLIVLLAIGPIQFVHAAPKFGISQSRGLLAGFHDVAIDVNGSQVYVAFTDPSASLGVLSSADNGTNFSGLTLCGGSCLANQDEQPAIAVSGKYLYVAWLDGDRHIAFAKSDDNGASFPTPTPIPTTNNEMSGPHIAVSGNDVYLQWIDANGKVAFAASPDNGATWDSKVLSTTSNIFDPQIATSGTNAYVTWEDKSVDVSGDITSTILTKNGTVVGANNNLSNTPGQASAKPQITAFENNVYEVWQESGKDIFFAKSTNNGTSFGSGNNLSHSGGTADNPQIVADATKVYVVWQDTVTGTGTNEIFFKASSDNGTTFGSTINVSGNSGESVFPKVALSGNNVYVVWQDKTIDSTGDILFKASSDGGATFGGLKKLNSNSNPINDNTDKISASSRNISTIWSDGLDFANYVSATYSPIEVQFSAPQYSLNSTATITVTDPSANANPATPQTVSIVVKSTTNATGITVPLGETGDNTGVFSGNIMFSSSASTSGTTLEASPGDLITATYSGQSSVASIVPITIAFDSPTGYDRGAIAHITVTDPNEHATGVGIPLQKIKVHLTSNANPAGVDIQLTETGLDSNIFGGATSATNNLIFMDANNLFLAPSTVTISQTNTGANTHPTEIDNIAEQVNSTSDTTGIILRLDETSVNSGVFKGPLSLVTGSSVNHTSIKVSPGDFLRVTRGTATENALITPNTNPSNAAILVTADPLVDTVTASFKGVAKSVPISRLFDPGGSGGGLLRPGLVLNIVASLSGGNNPVPPMFSLDAIAQTAGTLPENIRQEVLNHDPNKPLTPQYDATFDYPLVIDGGGYVLGGYQNTIQTITEKAGTPVILKLNLPATNLKHLALYANLGGKSRDITDSDTYIIYDKGQPLQKVDPHGLFSSVKFDLDTNGVHNKIQYTITFAKEITKSDIIFRAWNDIGSSADVKLHDVWEVQGPQVTSSLLPQTQDNPTQPLAIVPTPSQNVHDTDMLNIIKDWGGFSSHPISDSEFLSHMGLSGKSVPKWVSGTAKYVVNNDMTPRDLKNLVKYLVSNGIIK